MAKLKEVCTFYSGTGFPTKYQGNDEGEYAFYKVSDIANNVQLGNTYLSVCNNYISGEIAKEIKGCILPKDTVVFAKIGEAVKLNRRAITSADCLIDNNAMGLAPIQDKLRLDYFFYYMRNLKMEKLAESTTVPSVRKSLLEELEIKVPSLEEQKEIGEILDKVSVVIQTRKQEIEQHDLLIKARFVEMFGDPIYNANNLPMMCLNDLGVWNSGGTPSRTNPAYFTGEIDWYSAGELNTLYLEGSIEKITEEAIQESAAKLFKAGSMLVGMYDTAAFKMGILKKASASNQACACIEPNETVNIVWLYYSLQLMKEHFLSQRRGVRQKNLNLGMIKGFEIPIADRGKQDEFVCFAEQVDKSKVAVQKALNETQILFDSLMQEYFG